jgi:hypothetical protein
LADAIDKAVLHAVYCLEAAVQWQRPHRGGVQRCKQTTYRAHHASACAAAFFEEHAVYTVTLQYGTKTLPAQPPHLPLVLSEVGFNAEVAHPTQIVKDLKSGGKDPLAGYRSALALRCIPIVKARE